MEINITVPDDAVEDAIAGLESYAREIDGYSTMENDEKLARLLAKACERAAYNTRRTRAEIAAEKTIQMPKVSGHTQNPGRA